MSSTLFVTTILHLFDSSLIYPSTTSLSVQNTSLLIETSNSFFKRVDIYLESLAATKLILRIVITFNGATQVLLIIRDQFQKQCDIFKKAQKYFS